ncbi:myb/SANT-like DNA-binding domain-containing protein 3 [Onthophagus taurus]|uniref:myb/SANT-like DNA-binding domain-containing protein 3 n=1 Tax=Onthophagus taurus TaxID=166361 RepID=UPI0039BE25EF
MLWLSPFWTIISLLRNYFVIIHSILNEMFIPHKVFINDDTYNYDLEVFSHEPKRPNLSKIEKEILLELIENEIDLIEISARDGNSLYKKRLAWQRICKQFNSCDITTNKTIYQLKSWWSNYKSLPHLKSYEQIGEGNWSDENMLKNHDISEKISKDVTVFDPNLENSQTPSYASLSTIDKSMKSRKNVEEKVCDLRSDNEIPKKISKTHEKLLQELQLREIQKRYEIIQDESKVKLDILRMQLKQEEFKMIHAERDLEMQKQKIAILDLDIKQKQMDIEMRVFLLKEKQIHLKGNKRGVV